MQARERKKVFKFYFIELWGCQPNLFWHEIFSCLCERCALVAHHMSHLGARGRRTGRRPVRQWLQKHGNLWSHELLLHSIQKSGMQLRCMHRLQKWPSSMHWAFAKLQGLAIHCLPDGSVDGTWASVFLAFSFYIDHLLWLFLACFIIFSHVSDYGYWTVEALSIWYSSKKW